MKKKVEMKTAGADSWYMGVCACVLIVSNSVRLCELYSLLPVSIYGILQARVLEWVAHAHPRIFQPGDQASSLRSPCIGRLNSFCCFPAWEALAHVVGSQHFASLSLCDFLQSVRKNHPGK